MLARHELDEISRVLLAAADLIEKKGHAKYLRHRGETGGYCALGAIGEADGRGAWYNCKEGADPTVERLAAHLPPIEDYKPAYAAVTMWNNHAARTAQEVIDKLREVAYDPAYAKVPA